MKKQVDASSYTTSRDTTSRQSYVSNKVKHLYRRSLFWIDGIGHLVLGPIALFFLFPLANVLGISALAAFVFFVAFTVYGPVIVLVHSYALDIRPLWITATVGNALFLVTVALSILVHSLPAVSLVVHLLALASALGVLGLLMMARATARS